MTLNASSAVASASAFIQDLDFSSLPLEGVKFRTVALGGITMGFVWLALILFQKVLNNTICSPFRLMQKPKVKPGHGIGGKFTTAFMGNIKEMQERDPGVIQMEVSSRVQVDVVVV